MAVELKTDADRLAYALALNFATSIRQLPVKLELPRLQKSFPRRQWRATAPRLLPCGAGTRLFIAGTPR